MQEIFLSEVLDRRGMMQCRRDAMVDYKLILLERFL
jgi:hypothetical protein